MAYKITSVEFPRRLFLYIANSTNICNKTDDGMLCIQIPMGNYDYKHVCRDAFSVGVRSVHKGEYAFLIASPEKGSLQNIV